METPTENPIADTNQPTVAITITSEAHARLMANKYPRYQAEFEKMAEWFASRTEEQIRQDGPPDFTVNVVVPESSSSLREISRGKLMPYVRTGMRARRNDPCPCGNWSNGVPLKYKKCCMQRVER